MNPSTRVLSSINIRQSGRKMTCSFSLQCKRMVIKPKQYAVLIVSTNGHGPQLEWGCIPCGRVVMLTHISRLAKMQGYIVDALNQANAVEYLKSGITTDHSQHAPKQVHVHHPTAEEIRGEAEVERKATEDIMYKSQPRKYRDAKEEE